MSIEKDIDNGTPNNFKCRRKIRLSGGASSIITMPKEIMDQLNLSIGDEVEFEIDRSNKKVILTKYKK